MTNLKEKFTEMRFTALTVDEVCNCSKNDILQIIQILSDDMGQLEAWNEYFESKIEDTKKVWRRIKELPLERLKGLFSSEFNCNSFTDMDEDDIDDILTTDFN